MRIVECGARTSKGISVKVTMVVDALVEFVGRVRVGKEACLGAVEGIFLEACWWATSNIGTRD